MNRKGSAVWSGDLKTGKGSLSTQSGTLAEAQYSFGTRFENGVGTNPEELIAAAHAGCFSMALSSILGGAKIAPERIATTSTVTLEFVDGNPTITKVHLDTTANVPGISEEDFQKYAAEAKANCPISRLLKAEITMTAVLEG
ncbi:MAG: OsmC family protein [Cytophagales bacterium]|nr:OsmC family protein [Armatimonadota bacterium]